MPKTVTMSKLASPQTRLRVWKDGRIGFITVGKGNPDAIKAQQEVLTSCARSAKGLKGAQFKAKVKACMRK